MKSTIIAKEGNEVKFEVVFAAEEFEAAVDAVFKKNRNQFQIDGFRKGKAPRKIIERMYGAEIFYTDALNDLFDEAYPKALAELDIEPIDQPKDLQVSDIKKGEDVTVTVKVDAFPEMEIANYKGLEIEKSATVIGDAEVQAELERLAKKQARMETVERAAENGDTVIIDFVGSVDGVEFQGGTAENYELKLGSGQFIPGFEDQLVGQAAGTEVEVAVTFPEEYHAEDLAGKPAVFKTTVHEVKQEILPEIDDELASDISDFETLAEFKEDLAKKLQNDADNMDESIMKDRALEALFNANPIETPEVMIDSELNSMIQEMNQQLGMQGISVEDYMKWMGKTVEDLKNDSRDEALRRVNTRILLKNIIRMENIDVTDEELEAEVAAFGAQYGMTNEQVKEMIGPNVKYFKEDVQTKKAIEFIFAEAVKKEAEAEA
ncbi:MAG: trigger factor [Firmicutes bacterium]|nr:trigger factor [Bacillota bacterium]